MPISHQRLLTRLVEQYKVDPYGSIGWRGLLDEDEAFTMDQLFKPMVERGLVEDLTQQMGASGVYFVHITPLGKLCLSLGMILKECRVMTPDDMKVLRVPPQRATLEAQV